MTTAHAAEVVDLKQKLESADEDITLVNRQLEEAQDGAAAVETLQDELAWAKEQARVSNAAVKKAAAELKAEQAARRQCEERISTMARELKDATAQCELVEKDNKSKAAELNKALQKAREARSESRAAREELRQAGEIAADLSSVGQMDIEATIEETAKDTAAEADKVAADEAVKEAHEEAAKGSAGEASKETGSRTNGIPASGAPGATSVPESSAAWEAMFDDQPSTSEAPTSSRYLKIGEDLFVSIPGTASTGAPTEGEVFDEEAITAAGLQVVDEPGAGSGSSKEDQLLQAMSSNFQKLRALYRARKEKLDSRTAVVDAAEAGFQERFEEQLSHRWNELLLKQSDIENKDEEIEKLVVQRTQELEQKHKDALAALVLYHVGKLKEAIDAAEAAEAAKNELAGKVDELGADLEKHSKEVVMLKSDRDKTVHTLASLQDTISNKTKLLFEANDSIDDLKLKLTTLEETLAGSRALEKTLAKKLKDEELLLPPSTTTS
nr:myosin-3-like [Aegilops tauschii subsp. strangulata]